MKIPLWHLMKIHCMAPNEDPDEKVMAPNEDPGMAPNEDYSMAPNEDPNMAPNEDPVMPPNEEPVMPPNEPPVISPIDAVSQQQSAEVSNEKKEIENTENDKEINEEIILSMQQKR